MKIKLYTFGKIKDSAIRELEDYYLKIAQRHFQIEFVELKEISDRKISKVDVSKYLSTGINIFLTEQGKEYSSKEFSELLYKKKFEAEDVNFFIGNAFGFDDEIKNSA